VCIEIDVGFAPKATHLLQQRNDAMGPISGIGEHRLMLC
jgi:hypothetical protein